jgi:hypothetical protein
MTRWEYHDPVSSAGRDYEQAAAVATICSIPNPIYYSSDDASSPQTPKKLFNRRIFDNNGPVPKAQDLFYTRNENSLETDALIIEPPGPCLRIPDRLCTSSARIRGDEARRSILIAEPRSTHIPSRLGRKRSSDRDRERNHPHHFSAWLGNLRGRERCMQSERKSIIPIYELGKRIGREVERFSFHQVSS